MCGACYEVSYFGWMGGPHHCVVAAPEEEFSEQRVLVSFGGAQCEPEESMYITISGSDLDELKEFVSSVLTRHLDAVDEVRLVAREGSVCLGASGRATDWIGHSAPD